MIKPLRNHLVSFLLLWAKGRRLRWPSCLPGVRDSIYLSVKYWSSVHSYSFFIYQWQNLISGWPLLILLLTNLSQPHTMCHQGIQVKLNTRLRDAASGMRSAASFQWSGKIRSWQWTGTNYIIFMTALSVTKQNPFVKKGMWFHRLT